MTTGDHDETQDAYERLLPRVVALTDEARFDEALAVLDEMLRSESHRDHDGWLRRSVVAHRALILAEAGKTVDALSEWDQRADLGLTDPSDRIEHALGAGTCLTKLRRYDEAIALLRSALHDLPLSHLGSALGLLARLAHAYAGSGQPFPATYEPLIRAIAAYHDVAITDSTDAAESVMKLVAAVRER